MKELAIQVAACSRAHFANNAAFCVGHFIVATK